MHLHTYISADTNAEREKGGKRETERERTRVFANWVFRAGGAMGLQCGPELYTPDLRV